MTPLLAGGGILICVAVFTRTHPLRAIRRAMTFGIAAQYLVGEMMAGAWARRSRWRECVDRARREGQ